MLYPIGSVDKNRLLFSVAAYNFANFMVKQLDMTFENAGAMSLFIQSGFYSFDEVWHYYQMIYGKDGYASALDKEIVIIPISDDNYETLMHGKTLDEYMTFFDENFHDIAPELIARWRARTEADEDEQDEVLEEASEEVAVPAGQTEKVEPVEKAEPAEKVEQIAKAGLTEKEENAVQTEILETIPVSDSVPAQKEDIQVADTVKKVSFQPEKEKNLTLKDIEEIHRLQEEAKAIEKEKARQEFAEKQKAEKAMLEQTEQQRTETEAKQKQADEEALKAKVEREKQQEADRKAKLKQAESDKKAKLKSREELRKEKERAYKARLKQKEKERKEKERAYKQKLKDREKARKAELKAKEQARKEKLKK